MIRILANDGIDPDAQMLLEEAGYEVDTQKVAQDNLLKVLPQYDVIIVRSATKVRRELIDACPNLKVIARGGVGLDNIDVEYAQSKGIEVMNTPAASSQSVAELAFAHMFTLARFLHQANRAMPVKGGTAFKDLKNAYSSGLQLRGKTLGIIGFGRIGQEVARIGLALGMNVLPVDLVVEEASIDIHLYHTEDISLSVKLKSADWEEALTKSDFITMHVPFTGGQPLIGEAEIARMKQGVFLINTARGGAIDEEALLKGLESGKVAGAGLDVFDFEPTPRPELLQHDRVSLSPHIGAATNEAQANIGLELADKILAFFGDDQ
ncbi:MAG: D-2-hydroxyacid dehydrogenase [Saprospiraceae bacterium]|nr:D-2-hydroxyacid dehydrogenase [Saprospiraceae bacterium]MCB0676009.1 D-2-hydroxyacid dehydrogenase [Saprospiraceae bacterium]MCB0682388.1 D-2-hydroxyacid dehydrogenase [Saprospiraceae bacterium]